MRSTFEKIPLDTVSFRGAAHQVGHHNYRNRTASMHRNRKQFNSLDCGCPATTTSCNVATILQLICQLRHAALVYSIHLGSCQTRHLLTNIMCPYHRLICIPHQSHIFYKLTTAQVLVFIKITGSNQKPYCNQELG